MFNPHPRIEQVAIPGHRPCIVIDNFLEAPEPLVQGAIERRDQFKPADHNAFPGLEMRMPDAFSARINEFFIQHIKQLLGARRVVELYSRLSMVTLQPPELTAYQRLCHRDRFNTDPTQSFAACVLYLFDNPDLGGTSFYVPRDEAAAQQIFSAGSEWRDLSSEECTRRLGNEPAYLTASNPYFELVATVPAAWNRVIFYDGAIFHSAHITEPQLLSADPALGRLTLNGFLTCRRSA